MERLPYLATSAATPYTVMGRLPVCVRLDNVRSLYNVGACFRTAYAAAIEPAHPCGRTAPQPHPLAPPASIRRIAGAMSSSAVLTLAGGMRCMPLPPTPALAGVPCLRHGALFFLRRIALVLTRGPR